MKLSVGKTAGVVKPEEICGPTVMTGMGRLKNDTLSDIPADVAWNTE